MAFLLSCVLAFGTCLSILEPTFSLRTFAYAEKQGSVIASSLNVRSGAGTGYRTVARLSNGSSVTVIGEETASDGVLWYKIRFTGSQGRRPQAMCPVSISNWLPRMCRWTATLNPT